jgi:hypothetical protein
LPRETGVFRFGSVFSATAFGAFGLSATAFGAFDGSTMLGFASLASAGGLGRGTAAIGIVLCTGEGALTFGESVTMASGFTATAGTTGFEAVEVAGVTFAGVVEAVEVPGIAFAEVVEAVTEAGGIVAVADVTGVGTGAAGAVVVATAATAGQR